MKEEEKPKYDLEERLLDFGTEIITLTRKLNADYAERHVGNQLLRSGTAPLSHHGEAQAAESSADFIHKCGSRSKNFVSPIAGSNSSPGQN